MTPMTLAGQSQWHCGFNYANFAMTPLTKYDTIPDQGASKFDMLWLILRGMNIHEKKIMHWQVVIHCIYNSHTKNVRVIEGSLLWSAVSLAPLTSNKVDFEVEYLCKYEALCKKQFVKSLLKRTDFFYPT
jgi:hypothetical protein